MTTLGPGGLFNDVFVYGPRQVVEHSRAYSWFADWVRDSVKPHLTVAHTGGEVVPNAELLRFVHIGHTVDADFLYMRPGRPTRIYAAHREFEGDEKDYEGGLHLAGEELLEACRYVRRAFTPV